MSINLQKLNFLPNINFLPALFVANDFGGHPGVRANKCHYDTLMAERPAYAKIGDFHRVVGIQQDTERKTNIKRERDKILCNFRNLFI
jgi:hypothetical protein